MIRSMDADRFWLGALRSTTPFVSYAAGAAALTAPGLLGAFVLSGAQLGAIAPWVLIGQVAVALGRSAILIPLARLGHTAAIARWITACGAGAVLATGAMAYLMGAVPRDQLVFAVPVGVAVLAEAFRLDLAREHARRAIGAGASWVAGFAVAIAVADSLGNDLGAGSVLGLWAGAGAISVASMARRHGAGEPAPGPALGTTRTLVTSVAWSAGEVFVMAASMLLVVALLRSWLGPSSVGDLRVAMNLTMPATAAVAAATFATSRAAPSDNPEGPTRTVLIAALVVGANGLGLVAGWAAGILDEEGFWLGLATIVLPAVALLGALPVAKLRAMRRFHLVPLTMAPCLLLQGLLLVSLSKRVDGAGLAIGVVALSGTALLPAVIAQSRLARSPQHEHLAPEGSRGAEG